MKPTDFKKKYEALQNEAKAIAAELKLLIKRYRALAKKATKLGYRGVDDTDRQLYREPEYYDDLTTRGWNIEILTQLFRFEDECDKTDRDTLSLVRDALLKLVNEPFKKKIEKKKKKKVVHKGKSCATCEEECALREYK